MIDSFQLNHPGCSVIRGNVVINGDDIINLNGLTSLSLIEGDLKILDNNCLTTLAGLNNVTGIGGDLIIAENDVLSNLTGLDNLNSVGDSLLIGHWDYDGNPALISISALKNLVSIGSTLTLYENESLTDFTGLEGLTGIEENLEIASNNTPDLSGLDNISYISGYLFIGFSWGLTSLAGLENLQSVGQSLIIQADVDLIDISALGGLTTIGGSLELDDIHSLPNVDGLNNLTFIGDDLYINWANSLSDLDGLLNLHSIGDELDIQENHTLSSLTGLTGLHSIGGKLTIANNYGALTSLSGIENIEPGSISHLRISGNSLLSTCEVVSICDFLASPIGTIVIEDNAPGCNSQAEVEAACGVGIAESAVVSSQSLVSIYPNPSTTQITIETGETIPEFPARTTNVVQSGGLISIFNSHGQEVISQEITAPGATIDISQLPKGIYFVKMTGDNSVEVVKIVKQ